MAHLSTILKSVETKSEYDRRDPRQNRSEDSERRFHQGGATRGIAAAFGNTKERGWRIVQDSWRASGEHRGFHGNLLSRSYSHGTESAITEVITGRLEFIGGGLRRIASAARSNCQRDQQHAFEFRDLADKGEM